MEATLNANSGSVRIASALFFFVCVPLSIWESGVHSQIFVAQDPVATAQNLLSREFSFRVTIFSHIAGTAVFTIMAMAFSEMLRPVDKRLSRLMIVPITAQLAIVFVLEAINYTALMTLKAESRLTLDSVQQQEAAYFLMRIPRIAIGSDKIIFGFFFIPMGMLVLRSGIAPRIIGMLILLGGIGYVIDTCLYILLQRPDYLHFQSVKLFSSASYSVGLLWFMIKGVSYKKQIVNTR
jgi:hypothetical protein